VTNAGSYSQLTFFLSLVCTSQMKEKLHSKHSKSLVITEVLVHGVCFTFEEGLVRFL
jgi:hypothetical protein